MMSWGDEAILPAVSFLQRSLDSSILCHTAYTHHALAPTARDDGKGDKAIQNDE